MAGGAGDVLLRRFSIASSRAAVRLPAAAVRAPAVPAGTELRIPGLTPFFTSNASFYRVDTDLVLPQVSPQDWTLKIDGMVARPIEFSFDELLKMPLTEADITMVCVSNVVGGPYAGNARWLGVPLAGLLRRAGVRAGADQVLSTSTDGMTISTPVAAIMDGRNALLAVGMNGQPLPVAHGFPARMVVPGLYGYTSATKWVTRLTLTTFAAQKAYWTQRGYAAEAPIKIESRIDVPKPLAQVTAGQVTVAGVAWAPDNGIAAVEVSVDNGPWHTGPAGRRRRHRHLAAVDVDLGRHLRPAPLQVRATDSAGATQVSQRAQRLPGRSHRLGFSRGDRHLTAPDPISEQISNKEKPMKKYRLLATAAWPAASPWPRPRAARARPRRRLPRRPPRLRPRRHRPRPRPPPPTSARAARRCPSPARAASPAWPPRRSRPPRRPTRCCPRWSPRSRRPAWSTRSTRPRTSPCSPRTTPRSPRSRPATLDSVLANKAELTKILTYHVVSGRYTPAQLAVGHPIKTLEGAMVTPAADGQHLHRQRRDVVCGNVQTANATVYIIDSVLMPSSS